MALAEWQEKKVVLSRVVVISTKMVALHSISIHGRPALTAYSSKLLFSNS